MIFQSFLKCSFDGTLNSCYETSGCHHLISITTVCSNMFQNTKVVDGGTYMQQKVMTMLSILPSQNIVSGSSKYSPYMLPSPSSLDISNRILQVTTSTPFDACMYQSCIFCMSHSMFKIYFLRQRACQTRMLGSQCHASSPKYHRRTVSAM